MDFRRCFPFTYISAFLETKAELKEINRIMNNFATEHRFGRGKVARGTIVMLGRWYTCGRNWGRKKTAEHQRPDPEALLSSLHQQPDSATHVLIASFHLFNEEKEVGESLPWLGIVLSPSGETAVNVIRYYSHWAE